MGLLHSILRKSFAHGIHPDDHKAETRDKAIRRLPFAPFMYLPLSQHIGAPAVPVVKVGQEVVRGELIARANGFVSVPIHAPATGVIEAIKLMPSAKGPKTETIVLKVYEADSQEVLWGEPIDVDALSPEEIVRGFQEIGMVGLGGAAFPSHVKLAVPEGHRVDTLMVNGCECEPYLTTDHRVMLEQTDDLIRGVKIALKAVGAERAIIGVEDNKLDAVAALRNRLGEDDPITVETVRTKYPQGAEKILLKVLLDREVPSGCHSYDIGVVMNNVGTLAQVGALLPKGQGLIERVVTVTGTGIKKPGNYRIPLGTPIRFVLDQVDWDADSSEVILGGPMMGSAISSLDVPVTKGVSGILVFTQGEIASETRQSHPCIKCGKCVEACPMHLNPSQLGLLAAKRLYEQMESKFHLNDCFECGCCTYVCPSAIPLVQHFRIAKSINREQRERAA
jgi:electron transport complex protein RnfC